MTPLPLTLRYDTEAHLRQAKHGLASMTPAAADPDQWALRLRRQARDLGKIFVIGKRRFHGKRSGLTGQFMRVR